MSTGSGTRAAWAEIIEPVDIEGRSCPREYLPDILPCGPVEHRRHRLLVDIAEAGNLTDEFATAAVMTSRILARPSSVRLRLLLATVLLTGCGGRVLLGRTDQTDARSVDASGPATLVSQIGEIFGGSMFDSLIAGRHSTSGSTFDGRSGGHRDVARWFWSGRFTAPQSARRTGRFGCGGRSLRQYPFRG
jgi:hypothetical protein